MKYLFINVETPTVCEKLKEALRQQQKQNRRNAENSYSTAKRAEAQQRITQTMSSMAGNKSAFETFERMERKIEEVEAQAEATKELEDTTTGSSLEKQFAQLESSPQAADAMLEELKKKMLTEDAGRTNSQQE